MAVIGSEVKAKQNKAMMKDGEDKTFDLERLFS
jgi:hypothetical protein